MTLSITTRVPKRKEKKKNPNKGNPFKGLHTNDCSFHICKGPGTLRRSLTKDFSDPGWVRTSSLTDESHYFGDGRASRNLHFVDKRTQPFNLVTPFLALKERMRSLAGPGDDLHPVNLPREWAHVRESRGSLSLHRKGERERER